MTEAMPDLVASAAACMDSPRSFTSLTPSANVIAPAKVSAVYSPRERPAQTSTASISAAPSGVDFIFSSAARDAT